MTKSEGLRKLASCAAEFERHIQFCICEYAQYGLTLDRVEAAIQNKNWTQTKTEILKCLAGCPGCDLAVVNYNGELYQLLTSMLQDCENLIKNTMLVRKIMAMPARSDAI